MALLSFVAHLGSLDHVLSSVLEQGMTFCAGW
jgi:hypothetical protein